MLELFPFEVVHMQLALEQRLNLALTVNADVPDEWPQRDYQAALPYFIDLFSRTPDEPTGQFLIIEREANSVVGDIGFHGKPREDGFVEIGYAVLPEWRNKGIATRAIHLLIIEAMTNQALIGLEAQTALENTYSQKALMANGFTPDEKKIWRLLF